MKNKKPILLIGGGGHCQSCIDVIESEMIYQIHGIIDLPENKGKSILGYDIIGSDEEIPTFAQYFDSFLITIGQLYSNKRRVELFSLLKQLKKTLPTVISPHAYVSKHAEIMEGSIIMHHAIVNVNASIGNNCIINSKALIEHDVVIGDHCHISTGAIINGGVKVGSNTFIGSGSVSKHYISIPNNSFIKANSLLK